MLYDLSTHSILFSFLVIGALHFLGVVSPGPDFAIMVKTALSHSRKQAIITALGIAVGVLVHVSYCILGLALIITQSIVLFNTIKYFGAAYFIYIGIQGLLSKKPDTHSPVILQSKNEINTFTAFKRGFLCNVLNPKATLFFLGLFTLVIHTTTPIWIQILYGLEMALITFTWFAAIGVLMTHHKIKSKINRFQYYITKVMGVLLILFGIEIALIHHHQ